MFFCMRDRNSGAVDDQNRVLCQRRRDSATDGRGCSFPTNSANERDGGFWKQEVTEQTEFDG